MRATSVASLGVWLLALIVPALAGAQATNRYHLRHYY